jgi:mannosyltransferase OCH1-like enzyme
MDSYAVGFEEDETLRSKFIREITLSQLQKTDAMNDFLQYDNSNIPKTLVRYWHDLNAMPDDVRVCVDSWNRLKTEGFEFRMFDDLSAKAYIAKKYGSKESEAFSKCRHPAMRSDYLRMCFILAEGGFYVDTDDVLLGDGWQYVFRDSKLKLQPLCYDIPANGMLKATDIWKTNLPTDGLIFYINNDPIAAPPGHPVLRRALIRATRKLLGKDVLPEIQSTTGPGNITAALAAHARELMIANIAVDFEFLPNWDTIAETRWDLSYRNDARNWRNMDVT